MKQSLFALSTLFFAGFSGAAHADLTLSGAVGLPLNPTARTLDSGQFQVQADYEKLGHLTALGTDVSDVKNYGLHLATTVGSRLELSGGFNSLRASDPFDLGVDNLDKTGLSVGVKFLVVKPAHSSSLSAAIGAAYDNALFRNRFAYAVVSKPFPLGKGYTTPALLHLGVRSDRFSVEAIGGPKSSKASVYGGFELPIERNGAFMLTGEIGSKNNDLGREVTPYSIGVRYENSKRRLSASIGVQRQGVTGDGGVYGQIGFKFGGKG